jgi:hypothetical protein
MIYLIHYKNLYKCHNVPLRITTKKEKRKADHKAGMKISLTCLSHIRLCKRSCQWSLFKENQQNQIAFANSPVSIQLPPPFKFFLMAPPNWKTRTH